MKKRPIILAGALACLLFSGCASIVDGKPKTVTITSDPPGAKITIADKEGKTVVENTTPASVSLKRSRGFFVPEKYKLTFDAPGYYPSTVAINGTVNGWYLGNVFFGGAIGLLLVDPGTGAMWTFSPNEIKRTLVSSATPLTPDELKTAEAKANPGKPIEPDTKGKRY